MVTRRAFHNGAPPRAAGLSPAAERLLWPRMWFFGLLLAIDVAVVLVVLYFFFIGLADGSVSSFNITLWLALLAGVAAILGGGWALNAKGQRGAAIGVLAILALPGFLFGMFVLAAVILQPRWN
jgi:hypothetical protein